MFFEIKRDTVVIAQMDSVARIRLNDGSYFMHQCQKCKSMFYLYYPFLYRDPKKKFNLILTQQKNIDNLSEDERVVLCHSVSQFLLAFKIYDQCLNPKLVLVKRSSWKKDWVVVSNLIIMTRRMVDFGLRIRLYL